MSCPIVKVTSNSLEARRAARDNRQRPWAIGPHSTRPVFSTVKTENTKTKTIATAVLPQNRQGPSRLPLRQAKPQAFHPHKDVAKVKTETRLPRAILRTVVPAPERPAKRLGLRPTRRDILPKPARAQPETQAPSVQVRDNRPPGRLGFRYARKDVLVSKQAERNAARIGQGGARSQATRALLKPAPLGTRSKTFNGPITGGRFTTLMLLNQIDTAVPERPEARCGFRPGEKRNLPTATTWKVGPTVRPVCDSPSPVRPRAPSPRYDTPSPIRPRAPSYGSYAVLPPRPGATSYSSADTRSESPCLLSDDASIRSSRSSLPPRPRAPSPPDDSTGVVGDERGLPSRQSTNLEEDLSFNVESILENEHPSWKEDPVGIERVRCQLNQRRALREHQKGFVIPLGATRREIECAWQRKDIRQAGNPKRQLLYPIDVRSRSPPPIVFCKPGQVPIVEPPRVRERSVSPALTSVSTVSSVSVKSILARHPTWPRDKLALYEAQQEQERKQAAKQEAHRQELAQRIARYRQFKIPMNRTRSEIACQRWGLERDYELEWLMPTRWLAEPYDVRDTSPPPIIYGGPRGVKKAREAYNPLLRVAQDRGLA